MLPALAFYLTTQGTQLMCTPEQAIAKVERLLTEFRAKGPYKLQGFQTGGAIGRETLPDVCLSTTDGDVYEAFTNAQAEPISVYRGYLNYSQPDLASFPSMAPDDPEVLALADLYFAPVRRRGELSVPWLSQIDKNEITINVERLRRGRKIYGIYAGYQVWFQPLSDKLIRFEAYGTDGIPASDFPQFKPEELVQTAKEELVNGVVPTSSNGWHSIDHGDLIGKPTLAYFADGNGTFLVWDFEYLLHEKVLSGLRRGIVMTGGPVFSPVGDILIDALSGKVLGTSRYGGSRWQEFLPIAGGFRISTGCSTNGGLTDKPSLVMENFAAKGLSADDAVQAVRQSLNVVAPTTEPPPLVEVFLRHRSDGKGMEWSVTLRRGGFCSAVVDPLTGRVSDLRCI